MFEPVGDRARWRDIYELLTKTPTGSVLTYSEMGEALGVHPDNERHILQAAMHRAAREHEIQDKRAVEAVTNQGYRVVEVPEHLVLAKKAQRRSSRALRAGHSKVVNVDLSGVDPEIQGAFQVMARAFSAQMDFNRRMDVRQQHLEKAVDSMAVKQDRSEAEIAELRARLERLEKP